MAKEDSDKTSNPENNKKQVEGTVLKRVGPAVRMIANGVPVWYLDFRFTDPQGKRRRFRQKAAVQTQSAAVAEGEARKAKALRCGNPDGPLDIDGAPAEEAPKGPTPWSERPLREVVDTFLEVWAPANLSHSTIVRYKLALRTRILPKFGDIAIGKIDRAAVAAWDGELASGGMVSQTRRNCLITLRALLCRCAVALRWLPEAPRMPSLPATSAIQPNVLSPEQVEAILDAAQPRAKLVFLLMIEAGLRPAEVCELRWHDVQTQSVRKTGQWIERTVLNVRRSFVMGRITSTKSGKGRFVPVSERLKAALGERGEPDALVAVDSKGKRWKGSGAHKAFLSAAKRANVEGSWRLYDLRHYFCTTLFRSRVNPRVIMSLMGHADLETTLRYAHVVQDDLYDAIESKEVFLTSGTPPIEASPPSEIVAHGKPMTTKVA